MDSQLPLTAPASPPLLVSASPLLALPPQRIDQIINFPASRNGLNPRPFMAPSPLRCSSAHHPERRLILGDASASAPTSISQLPGELNIVPFLITGGRSLSRKGPKSHSSRGFSHKDWPNPDKHWAGNKLVLANLDPLFLNPDPDCFSPPLTWGNPDKGWPDLDMNCRKLSQTSPTLI